MMSRSGKWSTMASTLRAISAFLLAAWAAESSHADLLAATSLHQRGVRRRRVDRPEPEPRNGPLLPLRFDDRRGRTYLYVAQGPPAGFSPQVFTQGGFGANLFLNYDYVHDTQLPPAGSFFDVFFQVPTDDNMDYLARITASGLTAYEKPDDVVAPTPGGSFDPTMAPAGHPSAKMTSTSRDSSSRSGLEPVPVRTGGTSPTSSSSSSSASVARAVKTLPAF